MIIFLVLSELALSNSLSFSSVIKSGLAQPINVSIKHFTRRPAAWRDAECTSGEARHID